MISMLGDEGHKKSHKRTRMSLSRLLVLSRAFSISLPALLTPLACVSESMPPSRSIINSAFSASDSNTLRYIFLAFKDENGFLHTGHVLVSCLLSVRAHGTQKQ